MTIDTRQLSDAEALVVRAILSSNDSLWVRFEKDFTIDDLYPDSIGLLGQISPRHYSSLSAAIQAKIVGYHRYLWTKNQMHLQILSVFAKQLNAIHITPMAIYELGSALTFNRDKSRPLYGMDLVVKPGEYARAVELLAGMSDQHGKAVENSNDTLVGSLPSHPQINIHTDFLLPSPTHLHASDELWQAASSFELLGASLKLMPRSDLLLHNLLRFDRSVGTTLWVTDIAVISQHCKPDDIKRFEKRVHQFHLAAKLCDIRNRYAALVDRIEMVPWSKELDRTLQDITPGREERMQTFLKSVKKPLSAVKRKLKSILKHQQNNIRSKD